MKNYKVSEVSEMLDIPKDTLIYYDRLDIVRPERGSNGYRYYTKKEIDECKFVEVAKHNGFSLKEIQRYLQYQRQPTVEGFQWQREDIKMKNRVYFFTGTGNSLKIAKDIASALPQCEIIPICKGTDTKVPTGYDRIGFVFPVYFFGLPKMVADFVKSLEVSVDNASYWFAIATPGGFSGKPLAQFNSLLAEKNMSLSYGQKIRMNANYIARYGSMNFLLKTAMRAYDRKIKKIVMSINNTEKSIIEKSSKRVHKIYQDSIENIHSIDEDYTVTDDCNGCGICEGICPANNIIVDAGYPVFQHKCESCMACIQSCPNRVINFKDKTQTRKRYMHPDVTPMEIIEYYEAFR